jgi:hypothetical protein
MLMLVLSAAGEGHGESPGEYDGNDDDPARRMLLSSRSVLSGLRQIRY